MPDIELHLTIKPVYSLQKTFVYLPGLNYTVVVTITVNNTITLQTRASLIVALSQSARLLYKKYTYYT